MLSTDFSSLDLNARLLKNLVSLGYQRMTAIQAQSLPHILAGKDVIGQGKTGSGKTAAFGLGLLQKLTVKDYQIQSLVLCPTRELADQVAKEIRRLARSISNIKVLTLCGGMPFGPQLASLQHGAHIIVGTPGRIEDHLSKKTLNLTTLNTLVLDEADRMLDMGFQKSLDIILRQLPARHQTLLFSATYPEQIHAITKRIMVSPILIQVNSTHDEATIEQHFYKVTDGKNRLTALRLILQQNRPESALVFCNTKKETQQVAEQLYQYGFSALALHGDLEQYDRDQTLVRFANKSTAILVATDVAARGLDIDALEAVINYQIAHDPEIHIHRIGRTGRAGCKGAAYSLYSDAEAHKVALVETIVDPILNAEPLPPIRLLDTQPIQAPMATIKINGGKKQKVRAGDILGALTGKSGIAGNQVGKIQIFDNWSYVAIHHDVVRQALKKLGQGHLKGRSFKIKLIRD